MAMTIPPASSSPSILPPGQLGGRVVDFQQTANQTRQFDIAIRTREGDVVTISGADFQAMAISAGPDHASAELTAADFRSSSIQGDLNEEELADIKHFLNDLSSIATHFFAGRFDQAMAKAGRLGEMGDTLAGMEASFSRSVSLAQVVSTHPLPSSLGDAAREQGEGGKLPPSGESHPDYQKLLNGRWQQIKKELSEIKPPALAAGQAPYQSLAHAARALFDRGMAELPRHPEIAPLLPEISREAIRQAAAFFPPAAQSAATRLQQEFEHLYRSWLL